MRPAEDERLLRVATDAIAVLGVRLIAPTPPMARDAARHRRLGISLADGFAIATAQAHAASLATFDRRVRRALTKLDVALASELLARAASRIRERLDRDAVVVLAHPQLVGGAAATVELSGGWPRRATVSVMSAIAQWAVWCCGPAGSL